MKQITIELKSVAQQTFDLTKVIRNKANREIVSDKKIEKTTKDINNKKQRTGSTVKY